MDFFLGKIKAWTIDGGSLKLLHSLDSPNNSPVTSVASANGELVFGGCQDGSIIAWNVLQNSSDCMQPEGMCVSISHILTNKIIKY